MIIGAAIHQHAAVESFHRGKALSCWIAGLQFSGQATLVSGSKRILPGAGWFGVWEPGKVYAAVTEAEFHEFWCFFTPRKAMAALIRSWPSPLAGRYQVHVGGAPEYCEIRELTESIEMLLHSSEAHDRRLAENSFERLLLLTDRVHRRATLPTLDPRVVRAKALIDDQFLRGISLTEIADKIHVSSSRLAHLFRDQVGRTPMAYLEHLRMKEAMRLLLGANLRIYEVAERVGFVNQFHFSVRFRKHTGQSPRQFRNAPR